MITQGAAAFETVRDITAASHVIGDMSDGAVDDPLFDRYKKLGCSISTLDKDSSDYKMIVNYLERTYEPYKVGEIVRSFTYVTCNLDYLGTSKKAQNLL